MHVRAKTISSSGASTADRHFIIRGPPESPYEGGEYWGQLLFPSDYPFKPPCVVANKWHKTADAQRPLPAGYEDLYRAWLLTVHERLSSRLVEPCVVGLEHVRAC